MKFYYLIHKIMGNKSGILKTVAVAAALVVSPGNAETSKQVEQQKIEQKVGHITCATKLACDVLSHSIQAQIDDLYKKLESNDISDNDIDNISDKITKLEQQKTNTIITSKDVEISSENNKQKKQSDLIASKDTELTVENNKQEKMRQDQDKKIEELRGVLL